jgi:hypothetical protein
MCFIAAAVTKDSGVLACDSANYNTETGEMSFETPKLSIWNGKYLATFVGTNTYFSRIDEKKFLLPMDQLSLYLQGYLKEMKPDVENLMKESISDPDENKPYFCLYVMGLHGKRPTLAQFNSFLDFAPKYLWNDGSQPVKFATLLYGDDSVPGKAQIFKDSTKFMEAEAEKYRLKPGTGNSDVNVYQHQSLTPGLLAEILTRGIYKKADLEETIGTKKKYAGGSVSAGVVHSDGRIYSLSGMEVISGSR